MQSKKCFIFIICNPKVPISLHKKALAPSADGVTDGALTTALPWKEFELEEG